MSIGSVFYAAYRKLRRVPWAARLTNFGLRVGRKAFWALRPAQGNAVRTLPEAYVTRVTAELSAAPEKFDLIELGCGDGRVLSRLAETFPQGKFRGIDLQKAAIANGNAILSAAGAGGAQIELVRGSILADDIDWHCDFMISRTVLIYLNATEIVEFLKKRLPAIRKGAVFREIVSTTGETERSHFFANPLGHLIEEAASGQFDIAIEPLDYMPWKGERWTGANVVLKRKRVAP